MAAAVARGPMQAARSLQLRNSQAVHQQQHHGDLSELGAFRSRHRTRVALVHQFRQGQTGALDVLL
jgi:hypothetical protein